MPVIGILPRRQRRQDPRNVIAVGMRGGELGEQRLQYLASIRRRVRPVQQHPSQTGDDAGHSELLMQEVVQQRILPTETVVAPEGLDTQQVHGQDLANHALMGGANGIRRLRHPQQAGVLQQPGVHGFQGRQQVAAVGGAWQDHHH
ncbi:Uncharacterised protein [Klebsiella pneumoniae]|uniref:Uncharacterized protein n=3 Tax=Klebsiella pneumoniae TaxID=573 RepID=A0A377ZMM4_KLEPO|nr:Uncharacterised protein [Klebsiella pneumoniae]STU73540.1 Uncharacterised protein [Klebsiella pneumoniae subsp. ozaenae]